MKRRGTAARGRATACIECGTPMRASREPHRYTLAADWGVTIRDAEMLRCPHCGAFEVAIPRPDALHRTIAAAVIRKASSLRGPEIIFLRSQLGLSARKLAVALGVSHETLSRWENDRLPVSPTAERLLRTMVALTLRGERFPVEILSGIENGHPEPIELAVTVDSTGTWTRAASFLARLSLLPPTR